MASFRIKNVKINGVAACVPKRIEENIEYPFLSKEEIEKYIVTTGIRRRHCTIPDGNICSSDLCYKSAEQLILEMNWDKSEIELLIFVSQTADYKLPSTACILQDRLGLSTNTMAFDINYGCSGFVYGLSVASSIISASKINKALLLVGNTQSFYASPQDKTTRLLFGDAGTAMALSYEENAHESLFSLHTNGAGKELLMVPDGGCRNPYNVNSNIMESFADGIKRTRSHEKMDGLEVFAFGLSSAPKAYKELAETYNFNETDIDYLCLHQANRMLCEKIRRKLKFPENKVPYNISEYGNTSGASIPLLLATTLREELQNKSLNLIGIGFGVGLSWAATKFHTDKIIVPKLLYL